MRTKIADVVNSEHYVLYYAEWTRYNTNTLFGGIVALSPGDDDPQGLVLGAAAELGINVSALKRLTLLPKDLNTGNRPRIPRQVTVPQFELVEHPHNKANGYGYSNG